MNRFAVKPENAEAFEAMWLNRDSQLKEMEGFVEFHMLKGPAREDGTILYASHTVWESEETFIAWTKSDQFRKSHARSSGGGPRAGSLIEGHPNFEGFSTIQRIA